MEEKWWSKFQRNSEEENKSENVDIKQTYDYIQELSAQIDNEVKEEKTNDASLKAFEIMDEVVKDLESFSKDSNNPIANDLDSIKEGVNNIINSETVSNIYNTVKEGANDLSSKVKETMEKPEVSEKIDLVRDFVDSQLENENVKKSVDFIKEKANETKEWAEDLYKSEDVQNSINKAKEVTSMALNKAQESLNSVIDNENVQKNYTDLKNNAVNTGRVIKSGLNSTHHKVGESEQLKEELNEWKESAISFTKKSGRVIILTAREIKNNENVQNFVSNSSRLVKDGVNYIYHNISSKYHR